ncbi:MAG: hypothetical protein WD424_03325 [Paenibacillaceae bacterium]
MITDKNRASFGWKWIFAVVIIGFIALAVIGMLSKSKDREELKPGSAAHPHVFSYAPDGETIWIGTHKGLYEYSDGTWKRTMESLSRNDIMGLEIDPSDSDNIYVSGHGFIKRTEDGGQTWTTIEGLSNQPDVHHLTMDNKASDHLYAMVPARGDDVYETNDGGNTWNKAGNIPVTNYAVAFAPDSSTSLLAGSEAGLFRYDFGEGELRETKINDEPAYQILSLMNGDVIVMNEGGFVRSADLMTWSSMNADLNGEMPLGIKASKTNPDRLVIVTENLSVYESKNGGFDWSEIK